MPGYIVHFSRNPKANYTTVEQYLRSFGTYCRLTDNADTWIVATPEVGEAQTIRDQMIKLAPPNTQIFVIRGDFAETAWSARPDTNKWLESIYNNMPQNSVPVEPKLPPNNEQLQVIPKENDNELYKHYIEVYQRFNDRLDRIIASLEQSKPTVIESGTEK